MIDGLVQDYGNSSALVLELPQSCTKPICVLTKLEQVEHLRSEIPQPPHD